MHQIFTSILTVSRHSQFCSYFIPEDGDLEAQPNVFLAPKPRQQGYPVTLGQIKQAFPLPGRYHFRFKSPVVPGTDREKGALAVWMDCTDDSQPVMTWRSQIIAKVTRIGVEEDDDDDDDEDFRRPSPQASVPPQQQQQMRTPPIPQAQQQQTQQQQRAPAPTPVAPAKQPSFDLFDAGPATTPAVTADLLGGHHQPTPPATTSGSLLDMNFQQPSSSQSHHAHSDFFGMTSGPSPPVSGNQVNNFGQQQQQQQRPPQQQQPMNNNNRSGSFDSFGSNSHGGAFSGLGNPW